MGGNAQLQDDPVRMVRGGIVNGTHRFYVMEHGGVDPDEVQHGRVPVLQHSQARHDPRNPRMSYSNEKHEYCRVAV